MPDALLTLALYEPDIAPNAGAMMRTCACLGADVALIEPAGFVFSDRRFRRSGMDYLENLKIERHASFARFEEWRAVAGRRLVLLTTKGEQDLGNWIPEVARNLASANLRAWRPALGSLNVQGRLSGRQYDDAGNVYLLHGYFRLDAYASHDFGKLFQVFAAGENLLNRQIESGKTPTTTLGMPRVGRIGLLVKLGGAGR